jgi:hypothetical protein
MQLDGDDADSDFGNFPLTANGGYSRDESIRNEEQANDQFMSELAREIEQEMTRVNWFSQVLPKSPLQLVGYVQQFRGGKRAAPVRVFAATTTTTTTTNYNGFGNDDEKQQQGHQEQQGQINQQQQRQHQQSIMYVVPLNDVLLWYTALDPNFTAAQDIRVLFENSATTSQDQLAFQTEISQPGGVERGTTFITKEGALALFDLLSQLIAPTRAQTMWTERRLVPVLQGDRRFIVATLPGQGGNSNNSTGRYQPYPRRRNQQSLASTTPDWLNRQRAQWEAEASARERLNQVQTLRNFIGPTAKMQRFPHLFD